MSRSIFVLMISSFLSFNHLNSTLTIPSEPSTVIEGVNSAVNHPEGVAFSPSGNILAVVNALENYISFYSRIDNDSTKFETTPIAILTGPETLMDYPHDISYSPDGKKIAIASRGSNNITLFDTDDQGLPINTTPSQVISGKPSKLKGAGAVKFSPDGQILAVGNVKSHSITLYQKTNGEFSIKPYQTIRLINRDLYKPDGLAFSPDGSLLAVTSHGNHKVLIFQKEDNPSNLFNLHSFETISGEQTHFCYTHSVSFHPLNHDLAVSSASGTKTLHFFERMNEAVPRYSHNPYLEREIFNPEIIYLRENYPEEGGVKGIAFSPDGNAIAVCAADIADPYRSVKIYPVFAPLRYSAPPRD